MPRRSLTLSLSIPHTPHRYRIRLTTTRHLARLCAAAVRNFARRYGVPPSYVDFETAWGV